MSQDGYTEEQRAAAWAAYYAQQGYDQTQIAAMMSGGGAGAGYGSGADAGAAGSSSAASTSYGGAGMTQGYDANGYRINTSGAPLLDAEFIQQSSAYVPGGVEKSSGKAPKVVPKGKRDTVIRKGPGGQMWEDPTLVDWDPKWYRLFVGDVSNDVSERTLDEAFARYKTYCKCKVVRDRLSQKAKYAFIAFQDPEDFLKAWKEMDGKYVGNRPIRLSKVREDKYGGIETQTISARKAKELDKQRRNRGKAQNKRPTPW